MRFFSKTTRKNNQITLFKALLLKARGFVSVRSVLVSSFLTILLAVSLYFISVQHASSQGAFNPTRESLHIFPSVVESFGWANVSSLSFQELSEDALFHDFDEENSTYLGNDPEPVVPTNTEELPAQQSVSSDIQPEATAGTTTPISAVDEGDVVVPTEDSEAPPQVDESVSEPTPILESVVEPSSEPEPVIEPESVTDPLPEPTTQSTSDSIVAFFKKVTGIFQFVQFSTTTPIEEASVEELVISEPTTNTEVLPTETEQISEPVEESVPVEAVLGETFVDVPTSTTETLSADTAIPETLIENTASTSTPDIIPEESSATPINLTEGITTVENKIVLRDFGVPELAPGQFIETMQLRLSLGGQYKGDASTTASSLDIAYAFGELVGQAGSIEITSEISNALNGGYYLLALPTVTDPEVLKDMSITLTYSGDVGDLQDLFIDAVWLEVSTITYDAELLKSRVNENALVHLARPEFSEFLSTQLDFTRNEAPLFSLRYNSQRNFAVRAIRDFFGRDLVKVESVVVSHNSIGPLGIKPKIHMTEDGLLTVQISENELQKMRPGEYSIELSLNEGGYITEDSFNFQWGLLAINSNKTEYERGAVASISMGALTPNGNTLCNAKLDLYIIDPKGFVSKESVTQSGECFGNNVTTVPDYSAQFVTSVPGEYEMYLERLGDDGSVIGHTSDTFSVVARQDISIERNGPTRIYPPEPYRVELTVLTNSSFRGKIVERIPKEFEVFGTEASVVEIGDFKELTWDIGMSASSSETVSYLFDAPDLSPYLYELGVGTLIENARGSSTPQVVFEEHRQWQIASDATGNMIVFWDDANGIPSGWSCLSCGSGTFYQSFAVGSSTYNVTGGNATHTPTASASVNTSAASDAENFSTGAVADVSHTHTLTPTVAGVSNLPQYRELRVIQYTAAAGEPANIPTGAIGVFDVASSSLPSGWNRYAAQDGYYIRGGDVPGTTGGANNHTHNLSGTTAAAAGSTEGARGGGSPGSGAAASHTHTISSTTASVNNEPAYIEVLLAQISATSSAPNSLITMWTEDVPSGWVDISSSGGGAFNNRFLKATSTYGATSGGSTHAHSDVSGITSSGPSGGSVTVRTGTAGSAFAHTHSVNVTSISTENHLPPFTTAVFGKRQGTNPVYDQLSFRWYANENLQTPTDPWPAGAGDLAEAVAITPTSTPVKNGDKLRLRINTLVTNATSTAGERFQLQYGAGNVCSAIGSWTDVGTTASSTIWRGYDTSVADHGTLTTSLLASTTVKETFEENGYATGTPNQIVIDAIGEWDFVLENNGAAAGTNYCFRMIEDDSTTFSAYTNYAKLYTNEAPVAPTLTILFDNEKTPTTTPVFQFVSTDTEGESIHYQIQVDNDYGFGSTIIDKNTISQASQFENQVLPSDKAPFNQGELMQFDSITALANGTTYYWRVRGQDPDGSNSWGDWSTIRSFTIDTSLAVSAWFQTTEEQFDINTLVGLETPSADYVDLIVGSTTGTMTGAAIDFDDGTLGTAWGQFYFDESDGSNVINYQIEYLTDAASWVLIPDADLSGNSAGFTATTSLLNLDTSDYNQIRVLANFTGSGGSPRVNDWTVEWGYRVETPTITKLFPNEKTGTTTPLFEFTTTDPQNDSLTYQMQWSTDYTFTSSTTRTSDDSPPTGFINADDGGDTDPFTSGDTIQFRIKGVDALTNDTTYWWRVRAKDTTGDDIYSLWTNPNSFTVATDTIVSTWFQTTEEQFDTDILSGTISRGTDVIAVATTATEALIVYGEGTASTPRYRQWDGTSWGVEGSLADVGAPIKWSVIRAGTQREEYVAGTVGTDADLNVQVFTTGAWGNLQEMTTSIGDINARGFDIGYETLSGDAMVAYCDGDGNPSYYIWDGTSWTSGGAVGLTLTNNCEWIRLASDPVSDEIIILAGDSAGAGYEARVWNGSSWGNSTSQGSITDEDNEGMAVAYEESGGQAVIVTSDGNPARLRYDSWNGTTWAGAGTQALGDDFEWGNLVSDVGSDELALCYQDQDTDIGMVRWTGSGWAGQIELTTTGNAFVDPAFACIFETTGSRDNYILTTYSNTTQTEYSFWNNSTWSAGAQINSIGDASTMQLERTGVGNILGIFFDDTNDDLLSSSWNGTNWSTTTIIENDASVGTTPFGQPYNMAPRNDGKAGTTIVSPGIDFTDGVGPYWEEMSWIDTTPVSSDILYSLQYYDSASSSWKFIPDSDLPGNAAGTSTSPIDLSSLNKNTYNLIRPYASLSCDGSGNCPELLDWTIKWAEGITVSGTLKDYAQVTNINSGTVNVAVNGTLQTGKSGTVSGGVWSIPNVTTFSGDVVTVFVIGTSSSAEAVGITRYDGLGNITGLDMFERHLALGSDDATSTPLTNGDIGGYDFTNDEDLFFDVTGSTLNLCGDSGCGDARLYINASTTYTPGGITKVHDIENNGILTATSTLYVTGSWDNNATTTLTGSSVIFSATSSAETIDDTGAISPFFNNITFGTTTGNATWTLISILDVNGDMTVERGTLSRAGIPITIAGNLTNAANGTWIGIGTTTFDGNGTSNWSDQNATLQNIGNVVVEGSSKTALLTSNVAAQSITIGAIDVLDVSGSDYDITVYDGWINNNTFAARQGTVFFAATTTGSFITAGGDAFYDLTFNGAGGSWSFVENTLTVNNDLTVATGTVTMPTATTTIVGSFSSAGGTFMHSNALLYFTSSGAETIVSSSTGLTNIFYDLKFDGTGSWTMQDLNATSSNDVTVEQGTVTFPTGTFAIGGSLYDIGGAFVSGSGTVILTSTAAETLTAGGSAFNHLTTLGSGSWTFSDTNATISGDLLISSGTLTLPSGVLSIGGSYTNTATVIPAGGDVTFNSTDSGELIDFGASSLYDVTFNGVTGGWTITNSATTTNNFTLGTTSAWTLSSGQTLSVGGTFANGVGGASTTWTGSTLSLEAGAYSINTKNDSGDSYATLRLKSAADISMWNSLASTYDIESGASLYSQDHNAVDGDLYIFGSYARTSGSEYWNYATDFDGTDLTGGSERQVDVRFESGATAAISNAALEVLGASTATTTIANQGSGTYLVSVSAGTTTATYYDFDDLGATGVSLLASTTVTALGDGAFEPASAGGTGLTLASTTIDTNPALQIYRVDFSTTTPIAATNVTQTDGTPVSYWWFRESRGNIDGESFDNDTGNPGSVRWDDSALNLTISGTVYADDGITLLGGTTCDGDAETPIRIVVNGSTTYNGVCEADSTFSISGVTVVGDPVLTVFLNGAAGGELGTVVTRTPTADITDLDIYANRVITRHEDIAPLTISNMAIYDEDDDPDIRYVAATTTGVTLDLRYNTALHIFATSTFAPGGDITIAANATGNVYDGTLHLDNNSTLTGAGTSTYIIGGRFIMDTDATFDAASTTVLMNATTTGRTISTPSPQTISFYDLTFNGTGGGWNLAGDIIVSDDMTVTTGTLSGTGDITVTNNSMSGNGLVSMSGGTTTINKSNTLGGTNSWTFYDLTLGDTVTTGTTTPGSNATTTVLGTLTIDTGHFLDAGASSWNLVGTGTVFVENGTLQEDTSSFRYSGNGATAITSTDYYNLALNASTGTPTYTTIGAGIQVFGNLVIGGESTTIVNFTTNDPALNVDGDMTINANGTFIASDSASFTIAGNYDNNGIFTAGGGTLTFDGSGTHTIAAGSSDFSSVTINGTGDFTVIEHATATSAWSLSAANDFTLSSGQVLAVGGTFTNSVGAGDTIWTGSTLALYGGGNYEINASTTNDAYDTLSIAAGTQIRMWNSEATTTTVASTASLYSMDHTNVTGDLYIFGDYKKTTGNDFWNYSTDFDGTDLSGGGERKVDVFIGSGGTVLYQTSGDLAVVGVASASTTLQNQGSGTYSITIGGGASTTWSYYEVTDTDSNGLTFSGAPTVNTLSYGDFTISSDNDSAITVGGTAINANPAKTFTNNRFATSSGVSPATNVTATGTSVSSWRFTNHTGDVDGESFDVDPGGDPGYVTWDDSAALITIAGNVYSDEGSTASGICDDGVTNNVTLYVAGLLSNTVSCNSTTGAYSIGNVAYSPGDSFIVFITGETEKAATVSVDPVSSIADMDLYENRVIVRHENTNAITIDNMDVYDFNQDTDIPFTATNGSPDTLTLPANTKLIVWTGKKFAPGGNVTLSGGGAGAAHDGTLELYDNAVFTGVGTELYSIGGSMILGTSATFDAANSTTTFTTTGAARTIDINEEGFYNVAFTGSGSWTVTDATLDMNNVYISAGTVTLPSATTTVSAGFNNTGGTFDSNTGVMVFDASSGSHTVAGGGSNFADMRFTGGATWTMSDTNATSTDSVIISGGTLSLPSGTFAVGGDFRNTGGSITHNTSELILTSGTSATLLASSSDLSSVTISGAGAFTMEDVSLTLLDSLTVSAGSLTLATGTLSIGGSLDASGGTFDNATGTILFNSSDTGETIDTGSSSFYNVTFGSASGGWTINANATTTNNFTLTTASSFTQQTGTTLYVGNVFTNSVGGAATAWDGSTLSLDSASAYSINTKSAGGDDYQTLLIGANTDISSWNSQATTTTVASSSSLYAQDYAATDGSLYIYGDYHKATGTDYWSYATDFDGTDLTGGSERAVTVSIASGATTTTDGGVLNMIGVSGNVTTVQNQGSGTYTFSVTSGIFNAQYYAFRNLDSSGLTLSGTPTISSLNNGDFELIVNAGTLISLSSTTLNANASLVITGVRFATTTAITGKNVTLTGTTNNAWTFTSETGNLSGESFDVDGGAACGQVRWDDSSCLLTQQTHYRWRNDDGGIGVQASEWFDVDWDARKRVRLENPDNTTYTDAVIKLDVTFDSDMQADFDDLRFTDSSGTTSIPYFIATSTLSTDAEVWVKVPSLPAEDTATVFMYYKNSLATTTSSSTQTFIVADDFEDGGITEYSGANDDKSLFTVDGSYAYGGSYGLDNTGNESAQADDGGMARFDVTVSQGETIRYVQYVNTSGAADEVCTMFGVQSPVGNNQNYAVCLEQVAGTDYIAIVKDVVDVATAGNTLASSTVTYSTGWYEIEIDWQTNDDIFVTLSQGGSVVATTTFNDSTYTSGGIGFTYWFNGGGWDNYTSRPYVVTEPTIRFGTEQSDGGATWAADLDEKAVFGVTNVARLRLAVENSGLAITNQTFDLEVAEKGAAPSCESVSGASYSIVAPQATCGTDAICMQTSGNVTDGGATTDLLFGTEGDFILGEVVESPSNTTGNIDIAQDEYTELEYVIVPTVNATVPKYCFRVTDAGTEIDTYLSVGEFEVRFDPIVSAVTFNLGQNISLTPGTTTRVYATTTVTDLNGYTDLVAATSTMYRSGAGAACTDDTNNCYISGDAPQCTFTNCSGDTCDVECYADIIYHADATDDAPFEGQEWLAFIEVVDQQGGIDIGSAIGVEMLTLRSVSVDSTIPYGSLAVTTDTGNYNATTTFENIGNDDVDIQIVGGDLTDTGASNIPADQQIFATSTFNYSACVFCTTLATTSINYEVDLNKPTTTSPATEDDIYWGIAVPFGTASNPHSGTNTFYVIGD